MWGWSPAGGNTAAPGPAWTKRETHEKDQNRVGLAKFKRGKKLCNKEDK